MTQLESTNLRGWFLLSIGNRSLVPVKSAAAQAVLCQNDLETDIMGKSSLFFRASLLSLIDGLETQAPLR